jgi:tetratricopeptide (TPR) repeat protein
MAFHQCIECQNLFMAEEKKCPNCGKPVVPPLGRERLAIAALLSLVVVLGVVGYQLAASQRAELKPSSALLELGHPADLPPPEEFEPTVQPLEEQYRRLLAFLGEGQFERAAETLSMMKDLNGLNYRDTPLLAKRVVIHGLEEDAKRIPAGRIEDNIAAYRKLVAMDPGNLVYQQKIALYEARRREFRMQAQDRDKSSTGKVNDQQGAASAERLVGVPF